MLVVLIIYYSIKKHIFVYMCSYNIGLSWTGSHVGWQGLGWRAVGLNVYYNKIAKGYTTLFCLIHTGTLILNDTH